MVIIENLSSIEGVGNFKIVVQKIFPFCYTCHLEGALLLDEAHIPFQGGTSCFILLKKEMSTFEKMLCIATILFYPLLTSQHELVMS